MTALFEDSNEALKFAFRVEESTQFAINGYGAVRGGSDLTPHEQRAQAVFIRKIVAELPRHLRGFGWAAYAWNAFQIAGLGLIEPYLIEKTGIQSAKMLGLLVRRYLELGEGPRPTQRYIAREVQCHPSTVQDWERKVNEAMTTLEAAFFDRVDRHFVRIGLIDPPTASPT